MFASLLYIGAILGIILFGAGLIAFYINFNRFYGRTLANWVLRTRTKNDESSAEKLIYIKKHLEVLAHDILKHRLFGLDTLTKEMRPYFDKSNPNNVIGKPYPPELLALRDEFFRLCGIKTTPEERLWERVQQAIFVDIHKFIGRSIVLPPLDPLFKDIFKLTVELRTIVWLFVGKEQSDAVTMRLSHLDISFCNRAYNNIIALANASRMIINPNEIIHNAIDAISSQTHHFYDAPPQIQIYHTPDSRYLCTAPARTLVMCLTRLLDNALAQGCKTAVDVQILTDDFTGESSLIFKIYDMSGTLPTLSDAGMGLRGVFQSLKSFEGGLQYKPELRDGFKKAAIISIPISEFSDYPKDKRSIKNVILSTCLPLISVIGFTICLLYVLGGPPVKFAGTGDTIIEFSVNVGDELMIPLCDGGRNVRAEIRDTNDACVADNCSFPLVLESLEPCSHSINDPGCPGVIRWTPQFEDGQRQGKNYEISVHCISAGPPASDDMQRIRILVSRPNSAPVPVLLQLINRSQNDAIQYIKPGKNPIRINVTDQMVLRVIATDADADILTYTLRQPDGSVISSTDGSFQIHPDWSMFATSTFEIQITDSISAPVTIPAIFEADGLHPIELSNLAIWADHSTTRRSCEGTAESQICYLADELSNELSMQVAFDPLQPRINPIINFHASDNFSLSINPVRQGHASTSQIGDLWEIFATNDNTIVGFIELTNIEPTQTHGEYNFTFNLSMTPALHSSANLAFNIHISEAAQRMPALDTLLIFVRQASIPGDYSLSTHSIALTEYENDTDADAARTSLWIYPKQGTHIQFPITVGDIICQTPEFALAFETPVVKTMRNAARLDFRLKKGCIPGLNQNLTAKQKLCAANITFNANQQTNEVLWIAINDRACAPSFESINLISNKDELAQNLFKYQIDITDPDVRISPSDIQISGISQYSMQINADSHITGTHYRGLLTIQASCSDTTLAQNGFKIAVNLQHDNQLIAQRPLQLQMNCPPLVTTPNDQLLFQVDEGTHLEIPLHHEPDVKLALNAPFGKIVNDTFEWDASCRYGKGPHTIEITATASKQFGTPLRFQIEITRCIPRFNIFLDEAMIQPETPVVLSPHQTKHLHINAYPEIQNLQYILHTDSAAAAFRLTETDSSNGYHLDIECIQPNASETLRILTQSPDDERLAALPPITIPIECIADDADSKDSED